MVVGAVVAVVAALGVAEAAQVVVALVVVAEVEVARVVAAPGVAADSGESSVVSAAV